MTKIEQAVHDFDTMQRMTLTTVSKIAARAGVNAAALRSCQRDRDVGGLVHLIIVSSYGERTYRAARTIIFNRYS